MQCCNCQLEIRDGSGVCGECGADPNAAGSPASPSSQAQDLTAPTVVVPSQLPEGIGRGTLLDNGRYRIERTLGAGGMGTVYLAQDTRLKRTVVIKFPHPDILEKPGFRDRFDSEIRHLIDFDHPGVVSIFDTGMQGKLPFAVVQYLAGKSLGDRIGNNKGVQGPEEVSEWLRPIAEALDSIHEDGVLHRDIKPDNLLFDRRGKAYLSDFGISKAIKDTAPPDMVNTSTGMFLGSPPYVAPEYIDRDFTPACDQYSLATCVYEALTGRVPHEADTAARMFVKKATAEARDIRELTHELADNTAKAIMRGLSRDPKDRFESCAAFAEAFADEMVSGKTAGQGRGLLRKALVVALAVSFLAGAAVSAWLFMPGLGEIAASFAGSERIEGQSETEGAPVATSPRPSQSKPVVESPPSPQPRVAPAAPERVLISGGAFRYGCNTGVDMECGPNERSGMKTLQAFQIHRTEVSVAMYRGCVSAGDCSAPASRASLADCNWSPTLGDREGHPVNCVAAQQARKYCASRGEDLPKEKEWEKAARGTDGKTYPWGNEGFDGSRQWANIADASGGTPARYDDGYPTTAPVGSFPDGASPSGLLDMAGNVAEWARKDFAAGFQVMARGGSWKGDARAARVSSQSSSLPAYKSAQGSYDVDIGFRCVRR